MKRQLFIFFCFLFSIGISGQNLDTEFKIKKQELINDTVYRIDLEIKTNHSFFRCPTTKQIDRFNKRNIRFPDNYLGGDTLLLSSLLYISKITIFIDIERPFKKYEFTYHKIVTLYFNTEYFKKGLYVFGVNKTIYLKTN